MTTRSDGTESVRAGRGAVVSVRGLGVRYGKATVLDTIEFDVERQQIVALVGNSGCGKTTLLSAIGGFVSHQGSVFVRGRLGVQFQDSAVFPWMRVSENVAFGIRNVSRAVRQRKVDELLERTGLTHVANLFPAQLSGGQTQRVALARCLAAKPDVLLMDEPYAALDPLTRSAMQEWLLEVWQDSGCAIIIVTHDLEEAVYLADRVFVIRNGRIAAEEEICLQRPRLAEMRQQVAFLTAKQRLIGLLTNGKNLD